VYQQNRNKNKKISFILLHVSAITPYVCIAVFTLDAEQLARSQYPEGPTTGPLGTEFFLVSLCLKANAEVVPNFPSCHYMLLM
jgi:hypothetical protein